MLGHGALGELPLSALPAAGAAPADPVTRRALLSNAQQAGRIGLPLLVANLLLTTLATTAPVAPVGQQQLDSAPQAQRQFATTQLGTPLTLMPVVAAASDVPRVATLQNAKPAPAVQATQQHNLLTSTLAGAAVVAIPIGEQRTESAPRAPQVLSWNRHDNILFRSAPLPVGEQRTESAPVVKSAVTLAVPPNLAIRLAPAAVDLPIGAQHTESAPPTSRIGSILFARGVDPGPPVSEAGPLPIGKQETDSAPASRRINPPDSWPNLLVQEPGPIASGQSEFSFAVTRTAVSSWVAPNLAIRLAVVAPDALPIGVQHTDSAPVVRNAVWAQNSDQLPSLLPPPAPADALPIGKQQTASAPPTSRIGSILFGRGVDPGPPDTGSDPLPIGSQHTDSAPPTSRVNQIESLPNLLAGPLAPMSIASAQSEHRFPAQVRVAHLWLPPNVTINLPVIPPDPLPIGEQQTASAPVVKSAVWAQNSAQIPDFPPYVEPPAVVPDSRQTPAGKSKKRYKERYVAKYKDDLYQFATLADLEEFVAEKKELEAEKPKKQREVISIKLDAEFAAEIEPTIDVPKRLQSMPLGAALAQIRRIDFSLEKILADAQKAIDDDDEDALLWLMT